jgi:hypothetical protein
MRPSLPSSITLNQFTAAFVPFGVLLCAALLWPEMTQTLNLDRTRATIWAASTLLVPAFALYPFGGLSTRVANLAHLFWTLAYLVFLVHAWWAVFIIFHGVADTFKEMGTLTAGMNFLLVIWWGIEVLLLWTVRHASHGFAVFQLATRIFVFLVFALTLLVLRATGPALILGIVLVVATFGALAIRCWAVARPTNGPTRRDPASLRNPRPLGELQ